MAKGKNDNAKSKMLLSFSSNGGTWGADGVKRSKKNNGRILEGQEWNEFPEKLVG